MAVNSISGEQWGIRDYEGGGYATGTTGSSSHFIAPAVISVHSSLKSVQGITSGPPGAAVGVSDFTTTFTGMTVLGPDSSAWWPILFTPAGDKITAYTLSWEAVRADVGISSFALFWD